MNGLPGHDLEAKAAADRQRLHNSVEDFRVHLRSSLDMKKNVGQHLGIACGTAALISFTLGYAFTGIFVD